VATCFALTSITNRFYTQHNEIKQQNYTNIQLLGKESLKCNGQQIFPQYEQAQKCGSVKSINGITWRHLWFVS
jgi:hypothetical protein